MKKVALAIALSMLGAGTSVAADMAVKARPIPPPIPVTSWTGCYLGAGGGYNMFNERREVVAPRGTTAGGGANLAYAFAGPAGSVIVPSENLGGEGWLVTGQVGCDYQFAGNWLVGAFADADWTNARGEHGLLGIFRGERSMQWSWAVGGRVGWLITPSLLAFVSGGYTQADFGAMNYNANNAAAALAIANPAWNFALAANGAAPGIQLGSQRYDGFFIGGGTEYAISALPGLFWKTEYRYADYRSATTNINCVNAALCGALGATGLAERIRPTMQTVRSELVWRFNSGGSSVVARY